MSSESEPMDADEEVVDLTQQDPIDLSQRGRGRPQARGPWRGGCTRRDFTLRDSKADSSTSPQKAPTRPQTAKRSRSYKGLPRGGPAHVKVPPSPSPPCKYWLRRHEAERQTPTHAADRQGESASAAAGATASSSGPTAGASAGVGPPRTRAGLDNLIYDSIREQIREEGWTLFSPGGLANWRPITLPQTHSLTPRSRTQSPGNQPSGPPPPPPLLSPRPRTGALRLPGGFIPEEDDDDEDPPVLLPHNVEPGEP